MSTGQTLVDKYKGCSPFPEAFVLHSDYYYFPVLHLNDNVMTSKALDHKL